MKKQNPKTQKIIKNYLKQTIDKINRPIEEII